MTFANSEVTGTDGAAGILTQAAANGRKYRDVRSVTADFTRKPRCEAERAEEPFHLQAKAFPTALQVCPHLKVNHVIKWMQLNLKVDRVCDAEASEDHKSCDKNKSETIRASKSWD